MSKLIDLSHLIENSMPVYPGDIKTSVIQSQYLHTDEYNNHELITGMHAGTHIDSPMHLTETSEFICSLPLSTFIGRGCMLDVRNQRLIKMESRYEELVTEHCILLLYTGYDKHYGTNEYYQNHPCLSMDFCDFLIRKNIKMLGIDMPSPDRYPFIIHKQLFHNKIMILENLANLEQLLDVKEFEIIALPLKIKADSCMTRAIARTL